jgi:hypothetical protein
MEAFAEAHPRSRAAAQAADGVLLFRMPMGWQAGIESPYSIFVEGGSANRVTDIDLAPAVFRECCESLVADVPA